MRWSLPLAVLLIAVTVCRSYASESNDTLEPRFGDKGPNTPCNCTEWTCPRTFKGHCPPGPKCKHPVCKPIVAPDGRPCYPDNKCYIGYGYCKGGICQGQKEVKCPPSSKECQFLTCDPKNGICSIPNFVPDGTPCKGGTCEDGECIPTPRPSPSPKPPKPSPSPKPPRPSPSPRPPRPCPKPQDRCKVAIRDPNTGRCVEEPAEDGKKCNDGLKCTIRDQCVDGECVGIPRVCNQPVNVCRRAECDPDTGRCARSNAPDGTECPIGECVAGVCTTVTPEACPIPDDPCKISEFNPDTERCEERPGNNGRPCNDGRLCTTNDTCSNGQCIGTPLTCSTTLPCKTSVCNTTTGLCDLQNAFEGDECDDGLFCTKDTICRAGVCQGGSLTQCPGQGNIDQCKEIRCDPVQDACVETNKLNGTGCNTGNQCTRDTCQGGVCTTGPADVVDCSSFNSDCARGVCVEGTGKCRGDPIGNGQPCNDGRECITNTTCLAGECRGGQLKTCPEPENPCMMAVCDLESDGCVMMPKLNGTSCSRVPGSCTDDTCQGGVCTAGSARPNACSGVTANFGCQVSRCNITTGRCELQPVADEPPVVCIDDLYCTVDTRCSGGQCVGTPRICTIPEQGPTRRRSSSTACLRAECNERTNTCEVAQKDAGESCDTGNSCTNGTCNADGVCVESPLPSGTLCDDGNPCTDPDECNESGTCVGSEANAADVCQGPGNSNEDPNCVQYTCDPSTGCSRIVLSGTSCDNGDADACTQGTCSDQGECKGSKTVNCQDDLGIEGESDECVSYTCDATTGCSRTVNTGDPCDTGCRDGATCSEDGLCEGGSSILTCSLDPGLDDECADVACVNGLCVTTFKRENLDCSDGNPFTCEDVCNDNGQCVGDADECPQDGDCSQDEPCEVTAEGVEQCCCEIGNTYGCFPKLPNLECDFTCAQANCVRKGEELGAVCSCIKACGEPGGNNGGSNSRARPPNGNENPICSAAGGNGNECKNQGVCCCARNIPANSDETFEDVCAKCRESCKGNSRDCTGDLAAAAEEEICAQDALYSAGS